MSSSGSGGDRERLVAEIPSDLKELVDADQRTIREVVEAALWREFGGRRKSSLERRIEEKERRISIIESERNERERELEEQRDELAALKRELETVEDEQASYETDLDDLLNEMVDTGMHVFEGHGSVQNIAATHDLDQPAVVDDLKDRAVERDLSLTDARFERKVDGV